MGRDIPEAQDEMRTCYQRDRDRIIHAKAFRRLMHKTQVFISPEGDHFRTRLTHTLEVSQIARSFARALRLNEDLTEAIALGHDLGHTPFGHSGERALDKLCSFGFSHVEQSLRVVECLEKDGRGLNLTKEVRDGILNHRTVGHPKTLEGQAVRFADKIAYINHDVDDSIRAGLMKEADLPAEITRILGSNVRERLNTLIHDLISQSLGKPSLSLSPEVQRAMEELREWMFRHVYSSPSVNPEDDRVSRMLTMLYDFYMEHPEEMGDAYCRTPGTVETGRTAEETAADRLAKERAVVDYIAGMTDDYCTDRFNTYFVPRGWGSR